MKAENVNLFYGDKQILRNINFEVKDIVRPGVSQGQVVSLIGKSGIGKTQLFKLLSGLTKPTSGNILLQNNNPVKAGDMGVVFQNYYLFEWRTIYKSLELAAKKKRILKVISRQKLTNMLRISTCRNTWTNTPDNCRVGKGKGQASSSKC